VLVFINTHIWVGARYSCSLPAYEGLWSDVQYGVQAVESLEFSSYFHVPFIVSLVTGYIIWKLQCSFHL
jgi:hypothetical protein